MQLFSSSFRLKQISYQRYENCSSASYAINGAD